MTATLWFTANCDTCNPHCMFAEPVLYDDIEQRDREAQEHANKTGHVLRVGFTFL